MNSVLEVLFLRRPSIDYISCPVCEFDFSASGGPVIVLDPLGRLLAPSGFVLGGRGRFRLSWNSYPGALCYTVYKAVDSNNPFGEYVVVAECIEDPEIDLEPEGPGCYRVSAITENGETELSDPICQVGDCPFILSGATPSAQTVDQGDPFSISCVISNPGAVQSYIWFKDGVEFENTTGTTEEELLVASAAESNEGSYTLVIEGNGCEDESLPAQVTVNAGPLCVHHIDVVGFFSALDLASDGTLIGALGTRPRYHRNGVSQDTRTSVDSSPITASQLGTTITASADIFTPSSVGKFVQFSTNELAEITVFLSPTQVTVTPSQTVASTTFVTRGNTLGGPNGQGHVLNANNILVGTESTPISGANQDIFWLNLSDGNIRNLGGPSRFAADVNADGFVIIDDFSTTLHVGFLYNPVSHTFQNLGNLGGQTAPRFLNDSNVIAMLCEVGVENHACRWTAGVIIDIHPAAAGTEDSEVLGINSSGHIFGEYIDPINFIDRTFINTGGASVDIGAGLGGYVIGVKMNDSGMIVGYMETSLGSFTDVPIMWTAGSGIVQIPMLPATTAGFATGVNSDGWIVGMMDSTPFIHRGGITENLFTLKPGGTLWTAFFTVDFISDNGWISGTGLHNGAFSRYLMQLCS